MSWKKNLAGKELGGQFVVVILDQKTFESSAVKPSILLSSTFFWREHG